MVLGYSLDGRTLAAVLFITGIGVYLDYAVLHPEVFNNEPTLFYYAIKFAIVGGIMLVTAPLLQSMFGLSLHHSLHVAVLLGLVGLQAYYGLYPIPLVSGEAVQVGLWDSIRVGVLVHGGAFWLPATVVGLVDY